jgi:hypothetical protein
MYEEVFDAVQTTENCKHASYRIRGKSMKADSTLRTSRAVAHPSTNRALCRLTSEVERDPVHSTRYGRQRKHSPTASNSQSCEGKAPTNGVLFSSLLQPRQNVAEGLERCITTQTDRLGVFSICRILFGVLKVLQPAVLPTPNCCLVAAS